MSKIRVRFPRFKFSMFGFRVERLDGLFQRIVSRLKTRLAIFLRSGSWVNVETRNEFQIVEEKLRKQAQLFKNRCTHRNRNGMDSICVVHNFPDCQCRGVCVLCNEWIHPREWRIGAPNIFGVSQMYTVAAHKDYARVLRLQEVSECDGPSFIANPPNDDLAHTLCEGHTPTEIMEAWKSQQTDKNRAFREVYPRQSTKVLE